MQFQNCLFISMTSNHVGWVKRAKWKCSLQEIGTKYKLSLWNRWTATVWTMRKVRISLIMQFIRYCDRIRRGQRHTILITQMMVSFEIASESSTPFANVQYACQSFCVCNSIFKWNICTTMATARELSNRKPKGIFAKCRRNENRFYFSWRS